MSPEALGGHQGKRWDGEAISRPDSGLKTSEGSSPLEGKDESFFFSGELENQGFKGFRNLDNNVEGAWLDAGACGRGECPAEGHK